MIRAILSYDVISRGEGLDSGTKRTLGMLQVQYLDLGPRSTSDSSFLVMYILGTAGESSSTRVSATHVGNPKFPAPGFGLILARLLWVFEE